MKPKNLTKDKSFKRELEDTLISKAESFKQHLLTGKIEDEDAVIKSVRNVIRKLVFIDQPIKIIWYSDLTAKDLEPRSNTGLSVTDQVLWYYGNNKTLLAHLRSLANLTKQSSFVTWRSREREDDLMSTKTQEIMQEVSDLTWFYGREVLTAVNRSQVIPARMAKLRKKTNRKNEKRWDKRDHYYRSILPLEMMSHPYAYLVAPIVLEMTKTQESFLNDCLNIVSNIYSFLFINNKVILIEKPILSTEDINIRRGRLHNNDGPAVYFPKINTSVYCLHGVRVTKEIVMGPAEKLSTGLIPKTRNAEVRREIIRKIGIDRVLEELVTEVMDERENYQVVNLKIGNENRARPYLKMLNPSTGTWHVEGVPPNVTTVEQALRFRNGTVEEPIILT